ncbi:HD domain-containing protein [Methanogenium sp. MK-MG]|uniref:HD domain-containing protein n=1 Tax=Methanogenium sp. MK-MG TaxID=2599926 RepID=UPI0013ED70C4|nr:HD domain-containing protein [Methanogenium sp. MK-MG]KAF1076883.1 Deoxyguanosinetriphosphate triphosphohydrolase-like protein [Methanogenium sp. MK-MG]
MKTIKDPVHGHVRVSDDLLPLLDAPQVQRLRYVRQLGFSHLVYPGANHSRFEHSVGTMYLAGSMARELGLDADECLLAEAAGLLHDIGHGPFSHATEPLLTEFCKRGHDDIAPLLTEDMAPVLSRTGVDPDEIAAMVNGTHRYAGIIHGDLDVDRMDYLMRDAHYTGVPYGTVDPDRLIHSSAINDEYGLYLRENGINSAESLLLARTLMRPSVYYHHVSRIAESMILLASLAHATAVGGEAYHEMVRMNDFAFIAALLSSPSEEAVSLTQRILDRHLYKRAIYVGQDQVNAEGYREGISVIRSREIAGEIAAEAGVDEITVLVDIPAFPSEMRMGVRVEDHYDLKSLEEISPLLTALNKARRGQWRLGIYTIPGQQDAVANAAGRVLSIKKPTKQDKLIL